MLKERAPRLLPHAAAALGGTAVGFAIQGYRSRRQLKRVESENEQLQHEVAHDDLTGLLTKKALIERGNERLSQSRPDQAYALVFFDLDKFKIVNDEHPDKYDEGDRLLKGVAKVLRRNIRHSDGSADLLAHGKREDGEAARLGGDEFAGLFELTVRNEIGAAMSEEERAAALGDRIRADYKAEYAGRTDLEALGGVDLSIAVIIRQPGETMEDMLSRGAVSMGKEKHLHHAQSGTHRT